MSDFRERIEKLSPKRLALLALELQSRLDAMERAQSEPLAVVGMGCRTPQAGSERAFWQLLADGTDAVSQVPQDRWDASAWYDSDPDAPGRISTTWGGFVSGVDLFDPSFFNISAREAVSMDPQQRLLLEVCWEAVEHAGHSPRSLLGSSTGVFVGITNHDYNPLLFGRGDEHLDTYVATGASASIAAGRISYLLGLHGPSITLDTACSASLVALHLACRSLRQRECDMALAGGVNLILSPDVTIALSRAHLMAPDGYSKAFDARANGFVRGEGCGMVVLKRLSGAVRDGDQVLALIRGSAVNQDGRSSGLTAPNGTAQEALLRQALADARLAPADIDYIEAHGTGTALGDPIEAHALAAVFAPGRSPQNPLVVGSVKTNVGHLEAAAGVAGLIKTVLALQHERIPPHLHFHSMNPHIDWGNLPVEIPVKGRPWPRGQRPRLAGVSSFGFSGTNAHVIVEEAPLPEPRHPEWRRDRHILALSARTESALEELTKQYRRELAETQADLGDICFTANAGRAHFSERAFYVGGTGEEVLAALSQPVVRGRKDGTPLIAFLFPGQGAQFAGMGRELYQSQPVFRRALEQCSEILKSELDHSLTEVLWGARTELLEETAYTQPALFAVEYGLAEVWRSWGIQPSLVAGHSVGEYVAACVAGVYSLEAGLKLIAARGRLMQGCAGRGVMSAVRASEERVRGVLRGWESRVSIAAVNAPESVVIAGYESEVAKVEGLLAADGIGVKRLAVSHGFHSPQMEEMEAAFEEVASHVTYANPRVKWISSVTGQPVERQDIGASYWRRQVRQPVRWSLAMEAQEREGPGIYLEVGPGTTLAGLGRECVAGVDRLWAPSLRKGRGEWHQMLDSLGRMYVRGTEIDWDGFDQGYRRRRVALPTYPFERRRFWVDAAQRKPQSPAAQPPADWFYQVAWEPRPAANHAGPVANAAAADFEALEKAALRFRVETGFDEYDQLSPLLDRVCASFIVRALRQLGCELTPGAPLGPPDLARHLGVASQHVRFFQRLLAILAEESIIQCDGQAWIVRHEPDLDSPSEDCRALASKYPAYAGDIDMIRRCGEELPNVLRGRQDPLHLLFGGESFQSTGDFYKQSPGLCVFNRLATLAVQGEIQRRPGRKLRILEIGAGTGATTAWIAEILPPDRTEYWYTDISPAFISRAARRFERFPFFRYKALNIERDPCSQGFQPAQFDIIIAANVVHATADLGVTMRHIRELLAPSGLIVLLEGTRPERWVDLTFGLTDGWWRFRDHHLRPAYPLISKAAWMDLLSEAGFHGSGAVQAANSQLAVILARALHTEVDQRFLVVPDRRGVADEVASLLCGLGASVKTAARSEIVAALRNGPYDGVLYFAALDSPPASDLTAETLDAATAGCGSEILQIARQVAQGGAKLWLVTRGAQPAAEAAEAGGNIAQAPVWGWAKTISLEQPASAGGCIDLDSSSTPAESAVAIADAVLGVDGEDQLAIRNGMRYVPRLRRANAPQAVSVPFSRHKLYLITGGLGGLGLRLARWMAQRGARRLVLVGRTGLQPQQAAAISEIERFGAEVIVRAADIANVTQAAELFASLPGELGGIIHLAAAGKMSLLKDMTTAEMRQVMAPKISGTWNLHQLSQNIRLEFFVMFSSWASVLGAQGLGHYNAANQFMDALARHRQTLGQPALTVNWGAWDVIRNATDDLRRDYLRAGLQSMPSDAAFTALFRTVANGTAQAIVADVDWQKLKTLYETRRPRPLLEYASNSPAAVPDSPAVSSAAAAVDTEDAPAAAGSLRVNLLAGILGAASAERLPRLVSYLTEVLSSVVGAAGQDLHASAQTDELGLDSLMALEARNRINSDLGVQIPAVRFLQDRTIAELAAQIAAALPDTGPEVREGSPALQPAQAVAESAADDSFPLSFGQRAQWFARKLIPESSTFHVAFSAKASPPLDFEAFKRAISKLMARHPALRTVFFETEEGEPRQRVLSSWHAETTLVDTAGVGESEISAMVLREFHRPFDIQQSVLRIPVFRRNDGDIILFAIHHLVIDASSLRLCFDELRRFYAAELGHESLELAPPKAGYREFVAWEAALVEGADSVRLWDYWKQKLGGDLPSLRLPSSRPRPAVFLPRGECLPLVIEPDFSRAIHEAARQSKATTFSFLLAAFQALLCRYSGQEDLVVGTSSSARNLPKWAGTVGYLINLLPIRCSLSGNPAFSEHLARSRDTVLSAMEHQGLPFPLLVERLRVRRDLGRSPIFQAFFNYLTDRSGDLGPFFMGVRDCAVQFGHSALRPCITIAQQEGQAEVVLQLAYIGGQIAGNLNYNADVLDQSVAQAMAADYLNIVRSVVLDPRIRIADLPVTLASAMTECEELLI